MLATKNRDRCGAIVCVVLAVIFAGCKPAGPRALLDGKRLLDAGRFEQAIGKFKVATSLLNTNAQAWNYLGVALHSAGRLTNAVGAYQKALDLNRDLLEARYNLGCLWLDLNKPELAKGELISYALRRGNAIEGWLKLGVAQLRSREFAAAEKSFREALRISQNHPEALNGLGLVQLQRGRPREAVQCFNAALKQPPDYRPALLNLAIVSQQYLNDRRAALQRYHEYLALKPRPPDWEAVNALVKALEQPLPAPSRPPATNPIVVPPAAAATNVTKPLTSAVVHVPPPKTEVPPPAKKVEMPPMARTEPPLPKSVAPPPAVQTAAVEIVTLPPEPVIKTAPPNPDSLIRSETETDTNATSVARFASPQGQSASTRPNPTEEAPDEVAPTAAGQRYVYRSPAKPVAGNRREAERAFAQAQKAQGASRLAEAVQAYRQAIQADPSYFEAHYNLGLVTLESRSYRQSFVAWENALAIQPDSVDARYNFALALKSANYPVDAANELKQILAVNVNETRAHLVLGNLWAERMNDPAQARAHYLKVLELDPHHPQAAAIRFWLVANPP